MENADDRSLTTIPVPVDGSRSFENIFAYVEDWCKTHPWQVGVAEMSVGAALIAAGLQSGARLVGCRLLRPFEGQTLLRSNSLYAMQKIVDGLVAVGRHRDAPARP